MSLLKKDAKLYLTNLLLPRQKASHQAMELILAIFLLILSYIVFYLCKSVLLERDQSCYMLHYECYVPPEEHKLDTMSCAKIVLRNKTLGLQEYRFLLRTMVGSGIGEYSYGPRTIMLGREESPSQEDATLEMDYVIFDMLDNLFAKTGVSPSEIDILITTVSLFTPVPSLTARIINRYKMRDNVKSYNLSGMGCSASVVGIEMTQKLLKSHKNKLAIVVSTECMGASWYCGKERSMLLSNVLFRAGGGSILLTNKRALKDRAILKLSSLVRTHLGSSDEAYGSCIQIEDDHGYIGFYLSRSLAKAGMEALTMNLRELLPKVLPPWEIVRHIIAFYLKNKETKGVNSEASLGIGFNLSSGIDHFCVHPGGRAIIDGVGKSLGLTTYDLEPSRMALHRFGNTSSGGLWYVLGYMEGKKRLKKGDKILMISLGAGFECNDCVWEVMRDSEDTNVWKDCIDRYPPSTVTNPFAEKFNWIHDASLDFSKVDHYLKAMNLSRD
uniref:3-ketoacyl-CoA synthase n=1 Tax=Rhizophora mucronata TaxID=61149 RepID=A0A2P2IRI9_RHIMU